MFDLQPSVSQSAMAPWLSQPAWDRVLLNAKGAPPPIVRNFLGSWGAVASSPWDPRRGGEWRKEAKEVDVSQRPTCRGNYGGGEDNAGPVSWARLQKLAQVPFKKLQGADRGFQVIIS